MNGQRDTCDRCCQQPVMIWWRAGRRLLFCQHHSNVLGPALIADSWRPRTLIDPASDTRPAGQPATT